MRKLLRFLCCVLLCGGVLPMASAMAQTFDFFVVDICVEDGNGNPHGYAHPNDSHVADFCAGTADECDSGSSTLYQYIVDDGYMGYTTSQLNALKGKCLRVKPYGHWYNSSNQEVEWGPDVFLGSQSTGWMVICVAGGADTTCEKYKEGCDSNYLGETQWRKLVLQNIAYTVPQPPQQILTGRIYGGRTDNIDCCLGETSAVCLGRENGGWTTHSTYTGCEYGNYAKTCNLEGACSIATGENYGQARCKPGYFDDNGHSVINKAKCGGGASGMMCDPCPTADSGWTATSPVGSSECSQCYEYKSDASCEGGEAIRNAKSTCNGYNSTDICDKICTPGTVCDNWVSYNTTTESQTCTVTADDCTTSTTTMYRCKSGYYATGTTPNANPDGLGCISQMDCDIMVAFWRDMINMTAQERIAYCQNKGAYLEPALHDGLLCEIVRSNNGVPSQCTVCTPGEDCTNWTRIDAEFERGSCVITAADCTVSQTLKYRCAVGYYATGTSPNTDQSALGCTECPTMYDNTVPTTTSEAGASGIDACCVDTSYSPFHDPKGIFHLNGDCCWVNDAE